MYLPGTSDGLIERKELDIKVIELIKRILRLKSDRDRGTSPAVLRSSGPKQRPERVATILGVSGESARRSVSTDDIDYQGGGAYKAILKLFSNQLDDEKFAEHCKKFFKGEDENNT